MLCISNRVNISTHLCELNNLLLQASQSSKHVQLSFEQMANCVLFPDRLGCDVVECQPCVNIAHDLLLQTRIVYITLWLLECIKSPSLHQFFPLIHLQVLQISETHLMLHYADKGKMSVSLKFWLTLDPLPVGNPMKQARESPYKISSLSLIPKLSLI